MVKESKRDIAPSHTFAVRSTETRIFIQTHKTCHLTSGKVGHVYDEFSVTGGRFGVGHVQTAVGVRRGRWRHAVVRRCGRPVAAVVVHGGHRGVTLHGSVVTAAGRGHVRGGVVPVVRQLDCLADTISPCHHL